MTTASLPGRYPELYDAARRDPDAFWLDAARAIDWTRAPGQAFAPDGVRQLAQGRDGMPLVRQRGLVHDRHRRGPGQAREQFLLEAAGATDAHVDHEREPGVAGGDGQCMPVGPGRARLRMAGDEHHPLRML